MRPSFLSRPKYSMLGQLPATIAPNCAILTSVKPSIAAATLRSSGWLSGQPERFQEALLARARLRFHAAGSTIFRIGDPPGDLCGLVKGELAVFITPEFTNPALIHMARPVWWAGELAMITGNPRRIGLVARKDSWVMHVPLAWIEKLARDDHETWRYVARIAAINLEHAISQGMSWQISDAQVRVALALGRLAASGPQPAGPVTLHISHGELGAMARLTRNAVTEILAQFEAAGLVRRNYRRLEITDVEALARFAAERIAHLEDLPG